MNASSIEFLAADGGPPSPYVPLHGEIVFEARPDSKVNYLCWRATGGLQIIAGKESRRVTVRGRSVDHQVGASTLSVTVDNGRLTAVFQLTVVSFDRISAQIPATPSSPANSAHAALELTDSAPLKFATDNGKSLVMFGGTFPDLTLTAEVRPSDVPILWISVRDLADGVEGPGLSLGSTSGASTTISVDAIGSYFVTAQIDVRQQLLESNLFSKTLPVVLVGVTKVTDESEIEAQFEPRDTLETLRFASDDFLLGHRPSRVLTLRGGKGGAQLAASVELLSGGPNGRLFLDRVRVGWIQTVRGGKDGGAECLGIYKSGATAESVLVPSVLRRGQTYVFDESVRASLTYPMPEAPDARVPPLVDGHETTVGPALERGSARTVRAKWRPQHSMPLFFGGGDGEHGDPLHTFVLDLNFSAYLCVWTMDMPQVLGVAYRLDWKVEGAQWCIDRISPLEITAMGEPTVSKDGAVVDPVESADTREAEVRGPGTVEHRALMQTKAHPS
ncbi:MAG: hypothetical protein AAGF11_12650 [Myxococcota bacterium]